MFEFTKRSRKILESLAQAEARRLNSEAVSSEHIFIALLKDDDSVASRILKNLGVNFDKLIREIEKAVRQTGSLIILGKIPVNHEYRQLIESAKSEAKKLNNSYIGTEHLLLALFTETNCSGIDLLVSAGIDYSVVRNEILRVLGVSAGAAKNLKPGGRPQSKTELKDFTIDLTELAEAGILDPVIGRETEINRVIRILSRKNKNNPILIGEAGVGKTAIIEGLAQRIVSKSVPEIISDSKLLTLDIASIVAGTKYRGEFEERLKKIITEIQERKNTIVFIDEVHTIIGAGAAEGAIDAANILKPALARGEFQCIGATTINEYRMYVEKDAALVRRFQPVLVDEPDMDETIQILNGLKSRYEKHHRVVYAADAIEKAVLLAERHLPEKFFPDKAIDVIDEAGALARLESGSRPEDIHILELEIDELDLEKNNMVSAQEYERAAALRDEIIKRREKLENKINDWVERKNEYAVIVRIEHVQRVIAEATGIPVESVGGLEAERLLNMESEIHEKIIGQERAVSDVCRAIRRSRAGLTSSDRPRGVFLFLGPTGVGKSELAKVLAKFLFGDEKSLIRIDMSEYMEKHSISRLIGAPPGYIGYEDSGQLTEKVRRKPYSVILLDEIEKAHPDIYNILLQVFEEGELTDSSGNTASFSETIIIMTSNAGNRDMKKGGKPGFADDKTGDDYSSDVINEEIKRIFPPELLSRVDSVVIFHKLERTHMGKIFDILIDDLNDRLDDKGCEINIAPKLKEELVDRGFSERTGARDIRRLIQTEIEDNLASEFLQRGDCRNMKIKASVRNNRTVFRFTPMPADDSLITEVKDVTNVKTNDMEIENADGSSYKEKSSVVD
jgi:ATP-dependent Clp protease ATP-binding subunit ClpC